MRTHIGPLAPVIMTNVERVEPHARDGAEGLPIFCGCYDWHSAVHSHWALMRLRHEVTDVTSTLDRRLTSLAAAAELAFLTARPDFEIPYGLAWLLALGAEARGTPWSAPLADLERLARDRMVAWARTLPAPVRSGEHGQSAFALALALDWSRGHDLAATVAFERAAELHADRADVAEPGPHDFLSPSLAAAWLISRVRSPDSFAAWLELPALQPVQTVDRADGKLVHWDGLNLSRAWMLAAIVRALPDDDPRRPVLAASAQDHLAAGLAGLDDMTFAGSHWLPSFAIYALTQ